jgi:hypothetical protein
MMTFLRKLPKFWVQLKMVKTLVRQKSLRRRKNWLTNIKRAKSIRRKKQPKLQYNHHSHQHSHHLHPHLPNNQLNHNLKKPYHQ